MLQFSTLDHCYTVILDTEKNKAIVNVISNTCASPAMTSQNMCFVKK